MATRLRSAPTDADATRKTEQPAALRTPKRPDRLAPRPDERLNNFSIRVRHTLDDHLADLIYALRKQGVKTSKTEIFELLLWELPVSADGDLRRRIEQFRQRAPRV